MLSFCNTDQKNSREEQDKTEQQHASHTAMCSHNVAAQGGSPPPSGLAMPRWHALSPWSISSWLPCSQLQAAGEDLCG